MLLPVVMFEVKQRLRRISTYIYFAVFFALGALFVGAAGGAIKGATVDFGTGGKLFVNAPYSLNALIMLTGHFGLLITAAIAGQATYQDIEHRSSAFFFTSPLSKLDYLGGRFLGALAVLLLIYPSIGLGAFCAVHLPWLDPLRVGPDRLIAYAQPYLIILLPNLFFTAAVFFSLSTLVRRMLPVYVGAVVLVLGYLIALGLTSNLESSTQAAMLDPFGLQAVERVTAYFTVAERNTRLVPLSGVLLWNRLVWTGLGVALLGLTYRRFSFTHGREAFAGRREGAEAETLGAEIPAATRSFSAGARGRLLFELTRMQLVETVKSVFFLVIVLAGLLFVVSTGSEVGRLYGTPTYPVTYQVLEVVGGSFTIFIVIIITFYAGELVWRERDAGMAQIYDALPVPRWVVFTAKLFALMLIQVLLLVVVLASCVLLQTLKGYYEFEIGLALRTLFGVNLVSLWLLCVLGVLVHVVVNNKYLGHLVMVLYLIGKLALPALGFEHHLYLYGTSPAFRYSAMNGFGHFVAPLAWFDAYWAALGVLFALLGSLLWVRGMETGLRARLALFRERLSPGTRAGIVACLLAFLGIGAFIFWNTNRRNPYRTRFELDEELSAYERRYKAMEKAKAPRVVDVKTSVDIFPEERRAAIKGAYVLENKTREAIPEVALTVLKRAQIKELSFGGGATQTIDDRAHGFHVFRLAQPIGPGERVTLTFDLAYENPGFENGGSDTHLVYNGTFFDSNYLPSIGYRPEMEIDGDETRRSHGLAPRRMADLDDPEGLSRNYVIPDADWITFDATVSTSPDQIAIAPGYLDREWTEGGRRKFHYRMDGKILNLYAFLSARYAVKKDRWNDVAIEIDHHPGHDYNVDRMIQAIKASLAYFTAHFGPYQHKQVRIIEFPRYESFAEALPNTIPYSEAIGFIARVDGDKEDEIDFPFYVTAHEVAHQWWAHQVISGNVQGATLLSETLSQYSALMVMKERYGPASMKRFLRHELERYLRGRGTEKKRELPLLRVEDQGYIHYAKGSLVMYALQDYIGEATLNAALARYRARVAYQEPPYTNARELYAYLREATPEEYRYALEDMFETITLYENRATRATFVERGAGKYEVRVTVQAKKLRADELGDEHEVPLHDFIDIGVLDDKGRVLSLSRERIDREERDFTLTVEGRPAKAGIDPLNKLIDRKPEDNVIKVEPE